MAHDDRIAAATGTGFAERLLEVIDSGRRTATYKLALLLAILDLCSLRSDTDGFAPTTFTTRDLAEQVASLYWVQVAPFRLEASSEALDLRQITNKSSLVIDAVRGFRAAAAPVGATSLWIARQRFPSEYSDVIDRIERTLAEQPLPRLQTVGTSETVFPFIYDLGPDWGANQHFSVQRLRNHGPRGPVIPMLPGAGDELVRLAPLIRPLVELHWTRMVARLNGVATVEEDLRHHLFGSPRIVPPKMVRDGLRDLQDNRCFYCDRPLVALTEVDHFIPRVRSANDSVENFVLTDRGCNGDKSDLLAAPRFVANWTHRNREQAAGLVLIAEMAAVESDPAGTLAVARSIYAHLPPGGAPMWHGRKQVSFGDPGEALAALE